MSEYFELEIVRVVDKHAECSLSITNYNRCGKPARFAVCGDAGIYLWRCPEHRDILTLTPKREIRSYTTTVPVRKRLTEQERMQGMFL